MAKKLIYEVGVGVRLIPVSSLETGFRKGDLQVLDSDSKLYFDNGTAHLAVVTETGSATLTGKTYSAVNGSAASPSFTFDNSSTTGLYRVSADVIGISTGGTERARFDSSGSLKVGTTGNLVFNNERLSVNYSGPDIADNAFSAGAGIIQNSDTAVTASVRQYGSFARFRRTTTVNLTDTNTHYASSGIDVVFTTSGSTTYTNSSSEGINGYLVNSPLQTGAGSLAITNFSGIQVLSSSLVTGTNKYGVRVGVQSGATNNYGFGYGSSLPSGSWTFASTSTNPSYMAGNFRTGATAQIITANEQLTSRFTESSGIGASGATAIGAELLSTVSTPVTTSSSYSGLVSFLTRTTSVNLTDTSETMSAFRTGVVFNPSAATTYTHSGSQGLSGIRVGGPSNGGAGALAISNYSGIYISASSLATGTNKYGIRIEDQTGATNNYAIFTGTGLNRLGDAVDIRGTSINTSLTGGSSSLNLQKNTSSGEGAIMSSGTGGNNFLTFYTSASAAAVERLRLTSSGDVEVRGGTLSVYHSGLGGNTLNFSKPTTGESRITSVGVTSLTFYTNGDERLVIDSSGNVKMKAQLQIEDPGVGTNQVNIRSPSGLASSYTLTLPVDDGTPNQFLQTNGSGVLSWVTAVPGAGAFQVSGSRGTPNSITAAGGITSTSDSRLLMFVEGASPTLGVTDVTASPQISAGVTIGQELYLVGRNNSAKLLLQNGTGLSLSGDKLLGEDDVLKLVWDGTSWLEV